MKGVHGFQLIESDSSGSPWRCRFFVRFLSVSVQCFHLLFLCAHFFVRNSCVDPCFLVRLFRLYQLRGFHWLCFVRLVVSPSVLTTLVFQRCPGVLFLFHTWGRWSVLRVCVRHSLVLNDSLTCCCALLSVFVFELPTPTWPGHSLFC